ncbi:hypothetical protein CRUP_000725, partial [Coryphaenoides rupestris]
GFDRAVEDWRQFHCDLNDLSQWLGDTEGLLAEGTGPDGQLDLDTAALHQQRIIGQLSGPDGPLLQGKLEGLGQRWRAVNRLVLERRRRLAGGDSGALTELVRRSGELSHWLQEAENAAASLPEAAATERSRQELKVLLLLLLLLYSLPTAHTDVFPGWVVLLSALAEEMDGQTDSLAWLNKHGPQILSSPAVTRDLLDRAGEAESNLHGHAVFQERMNRLTDWVQVTHQTVLTRGVNPVQAQALESSMKERKRDLEDLLARSIELQRRQQ